MNMNILLLLLIAGLSPGLSQDQVISSRREEFREFEDCGKRRKIDPTKEYLFNDCLWDCKWKHNPFYRHGNEFRFEDENITSFITTPRVPQDLACLGDCFLSSSVFRECNGCCSDLQTCQYNDPSINSPSACFFKCFREKRASSNGKFLASTYYDMAVEFCRIALSPEGVELNLFPNGDCGTISIQKFHQNPFREKSRELKKLHRIVGSDGSDKDRIFGSSVYPVDLTPDTRFHPWLCSLRTRGFRGRHRCGVTLLSGPTEAENHATVLVGTAHCNYICKERESGNIYETCCCRPESSKSSCKEASSYCRGDPIFTLADPDDLQIVCGEFNVESPETEVSSSEGEQVLDILQIINHPDYQPNQDPGVGGPLEGNDISVYIVDDSRFKMVKGVTWPVCLPKDEYDPENLGIIVGWQDSEPTYLYESSTILEYRRSNFYPRQLQVEEIICRDPPWMSSNTYYPQGVVCYRDPTLASCPEFGVSGSGIVRKWRNDPKDNEDQFSLIGPLSMSKGCDQGYSNPFLYRGENAAVATDATCFMAWVAQQYDLTLPQGYTMKASCSQGKGDRADFNKTVCRTSFGTYCDFSYKDSEGDLWDSCRLLAREGLAYNMNRCYDNTGRMTNCANNCKGVDPNAIIVGGVAAATAIVGGVGFLGQVLGIGGIGAAGAVGAVGGALMTRMTTCRSPLCQVGNQCCRLISNNGRIECPFRC